MARRDGRIDKAVGLLERSLGDDPGLWLTNFLVGRAYVELKRFHQARVHLQRALLWAEANGPQQTPAREPLVAGAEIAPSSSPSWRAPRPASANRRPR